MNAAEASARKEAVGWAGRISLPQYIERHGEASLLGFRLELDKSVEVGTIIGVLRCAPRVSPDQMMPAPPRR
jgi:hypothetical protein